MWFLRGFDHFLDIPPGENNAPVDCFPFPPFSQNMEANWRSGRHTLTRIECHSENSKGVYCLQYDDQKIVSGLRDNTIKVTHDGPVTII